MRGYLPLIRKDSSTYMHGLAGFVKEGLPFALDLSPENSADSYLCFRLALRALCMVFDSILSNIDGVLLINPSANVFVFEDFNVHHKHGTGETDRPVELCYNFSISIDFTQVINFLTWIPDCDSHRPAFFHLFLSSVDSICSAMAFPPWGNPDHVVVSVSIDFSSNSQRDALFIT